MSRTCKSITDVIALTLAQIQSRTFHARQSGHSQEAFRGSHRELEVLAGAGSLQD
jgi:hypothetical protein